MKKKLPNKKVGHPWMGMTVRLKAGDGTLWTVCEAWADQNPEGLFREPLLTLSRVETGRPPIRQSAYPKDLELVTD